MKACATVLCQLPDKNTFLKQLAYFSELGGDSRIKQPQIMGRELDQYKVRRGPGGGEGGKGE